MSGIILRPEDTYTFNRLAREQLKHKLLADILVDMEICKLEGRDIKEYIQEIKLMLDDIIEKRNKLTPKTYPK